VTISSNDARDSGIRKAAIFVASLDQSAADLLLDQLPPDCAERVRQAAITIDRIDVEERRRVIDEFRRIGMMIPDSSPSGIELDGPMANRLGTLAPTVSSDVESEEQDLLPAAVQAEAADASKDVQPFGFLHDAEEEKLAELLEGERPQTVAMVLSHLPPQRAGDVLGRLPSTVQVEVVRRLVDLERTDADTLREIEQALEARLARQFAIEPGRRSGPDVVARILAACSSRVAGGILDNLAEYDRTLAEQLGHKTMKFDDLIHLDDAVLSAVVEAVEPEVVQAALLGAPPSLVDRILRGMRPDDARRLGEKLSCPEPIRLSDVEEARRQIATLAHRMTYDCPIPTARAA
jgi:flagellar motor switch protein FliG